jgi:DNA-binding IclR family transcriptional regulator
MVAGGPSEAGRENRRASREDLDRIRFQGAVRDRARVAAGMSGESVPLPRTAPRTGVGVLDRCVAILNAVDAGAHSFTDLVEATGLTRPTTHRLILGLEDHGFLVNLGGLGYALGPRLLALATTAMREPPLRELARPVLERLARSTGESAQLYVREGDRRICIDAAESDSELRTIVDVGTELPITAGSAGKVFLAFDRTPQGAELVANAEPLTAATPVGERLERQLATVRRVGWASSAGERQPGVGSVSAPIFEPYGSIMAVVSVSGPEQRIGRVSAKRYAPAVLEAAREIERALGG